MDKLRAIRLFVRVAELSSFTEVAAEHGSTKSLISKEIRRLEDEIGVRLLHRSTRHINLTAAGEGYLQHCREVLLKLADAEAYVRGVQGAARGKLRINTPMALGITDLSRAFAEFLAQHPGIELDLQLSDEPIDLIENGFDLGFRVTPNLQDSNYIGKALREFDYRVCTTSAYLEEHGPVTHVNDLKHHNCFVYTYFSGRNIWPLGKGVAVSGNMKANSTLLITEFIKSGQGIGLVPSFIADKLLDEDKMVEILKAVPRPRLHLYALFPAREFLPPALKLCVEFLQNWFAEARM